MKSIMISDKPKWCALMMNGDKTVEVRTSKALANAIQKLIDENGYADIYVYCTKGDVLEYFYDTNDNFGEYITHKDKCWGDEQLNGKVLFKFRCYKVEEIRVVEDNNYYEDDFDYYYETETCISDENPFFDMDKKSLEKLSCLETDELDEYLDSKGGYAIHISDLEIFDEPKELSEFYKVGFDKALKESLEFEPYPICSVRLEKQYQLTKAPQNFTYIESEE